MSSHGKQEETLIIRGHVRLGDTCFTLLYSEAARWKELFETEKSVTSHHLKSSVLSQLDSAFGVVK